MAVRNIVCECDVGRKVGARVESARAFTAVERREGMLEHPVGTAGGGFEATGCAVAGGVDAVFVVEVDHSDHTCDINAGEISHASTLVRGCLQSRKLMLGDFPSANSVVIVLVPTRKDVDIVVGVIILIALAKAVEGTSKDARSEKDGGKNGGG